MTRLALAVVVGALAVPATAAAASTPVTVATTTTPDGASVRLVVRDSAHGVCPTVVWDSGLRLPFECRRPPRTASQDADAFGEIAGNGRDQVIAGMTSAKTATIDLRFNRKSRRLEVPTVDAPSYTGRRRGRVRFYLAAFPPPQPVYARFLSASGRLRVASDLDPYRRTPVLGPKVVGRGRLSGHRFRITVSERSFLEPRPGRPEHRTTLPCLDIATRSGGGGSCGPVFRRSATLDWEGSCRNGPVVVYGTAPPRANRVVLELRRGRTRTVHTRPLPRWSRFGHVRLYVTTLRHAGSLRRVWARGPNGALLGHVLRAHLPQGPARGTCGGETARKALP